MNQFHRAIISSIMDMDASSVHADKGPDEGVQIQYGCRYGSQTREAFAYIFDPEKFSAADAMAYLEGKGIGITEFRPAMERVVLAKKKPSGYVEIECEVARVGKWRPNVFDAKGKPVEDAEIEFTAAMFTDMVESFSGAAPFKLGHGDDQSGAREMFADGDAPMGAIHALRIDGDALVAKAKVPQSVKDAIDARLLLQRSIEATKRAGRWVLDAVAWLKNTPPAVQGMPDAQVAASIFASARLVLADAAPSPGGPDEKSGEDDSTKGTVPEVQQDPDPDKGKETDDMSEELKAAQAQATKLLASYVAQAGRIVDGLVGVKLTPGQGESAKKLIASMTTVEAIDAQIEFLQAGADLPDRTQRNGSSALPPEDKPKTTTDKIMAAVREVRAQHPNMSEFEAARIVASANPELSHQWETESNLQIKARG